MYNTTFKGGGKMIWKSMSVLQLFLSDDVRMDGAQTLVAALFRGPQGFSG